MAYALNSQGLLANPATVERSEPCHCLECGEKVDLRRGDVRVAHFAHQKGSRCAGESVQHLAAKQRLKEFFEQHLGSDLILQWRLRCPGTFYRHIDRESIRTKKYSCSRGAMLVQGYQVPRYDRVVLEYSQGNCRADVALLDGEQVVFWLEVFFSHRVDDLKATRLTAPWAEMKAEDVLKDPMTLSLLGWQGAGRCPECTVRQKSHQHHMDEQEEKIQALLLKRRQEREKQLKWEQEQHEQEKARQQNLKRVFAFAGFYFREHGVDLQWHSDTLFVAMRCQKCRRAVVFFDLHDQIPHVHLLSKLLVCPPGNRNQKVSHQRNHVNRCPHCGSWHGRKMMDEVQEDEDHCFAFYGSEFLGFLAEEGNTDL